MLLLESKHAGIAPSQWGEVAEIFLFKMPGICYFSNLKSELRVPKILGRLGRLRNIRSEKFPVWVYVFGCMLLDFLFFFPIYLCS